MYGVFKVVFDYFVFIFGVEIGLMMYVVDLGDMRILMY